VSKGSTQKGDQINIMIIGQTGTGKSYFTNAMLGCPNPANCPDLAGVSGTEIAKAFEIPKIMNL